ncbi:unnamed protein product [Ilex paraguariensis]|uniref:Uncharacterized protein n=1 Tax=Ilex paraguariensis TaxID=185542 RepID=A0ABC8SXD1_9AQUA
MGSCVSVHRDSESAMKLRLSFGSKTDKFVIPSPDKPVVAGDNHRIAEVALKSQWSPPRLMTNIREFGSKEETFFDSQPCLESDCEDDFLSVNGDFTPSRGSTPVHQSFSGETPKRLDTTLFEERVLGSKPEPSPIENKKSLAELFKDSLQSDWDFDEQDIPGDENDANGKMEGKTTTKLALPPKSASGTPYVSGANSVCSGERTPSGNFKPEEKSVRSAQCCLPRLRSNRSFSDRKKMSPLRVMG